jgi:hypothetical protein
MGSAVRGVGKGILEEGGMEIKVQMARKEELEHGNCFSVKELDGRGGRRELGIGLTNKSDGKGRERKKRRK